MDRFSAFPRDYPSFGERMSAMVERGLRIARRMAVAFGLSVLGAIFIGSAVTDNAFAQIVVTILAAIALWLPILFAIVSVESWFAKRRRQPAGAMTIDSQAALETGRHWQRLEAVAPGQSERLRAIQRSLESSRAAFQPTSLNPDVHDLCVLIDRRLPELIDHQLDSLPPDDRGRRQAVGELVDLVEQFARHCGRTRDGDPAVSAHQAEVLRRRFEERLSDRGLPAQ
jgi:hypothetical protein